MTSLAKSVVDKGHVYKLFDLNLIEALNKLELSTCARFVYLSMLALSDKVGSLLISDEFISNMMNLSDSQVVKGKKELKNKNIISVTTEGELVCGYKLNCIVRIAMEE